jgi:uncharacterized protein (DUF2147 family)
MRMGTAVRRATVRALFALVLVGLGATGHAADDADERLLGDWLTQDKDGVIRFARAATGAIDGTIVGGNDPGRVDSRNPDPGERQKPLRGKVIAKGFRYDGSEYWVGGTIYDPNNGSTYKCRMRVVPDGRLEVRGYIGTPLLGRTAVWTRVPGVPNR